MVKHQTIEAPIVIRTTGLSVEAKEMFDTIARRAYEIFEAKGRVRGRELEHWLQAEAELFEPATIHVKESPESVTVLADVRGFAPKELEVDLEPKRVTIIGKHQRPAEKHSTRMLRSMQLPIEIDTHRATARLRRGVLELDVKKMLAAKGKSASGNGDAKRA